MTNARVFMQFALITLFLTSDLAPSRAQAPEAGTLRGVITDEVGAVMPRAVVLIQDWKVEDYGRSWVPKHYPLIFADSGGQWSSELPPGTYDVFITFPGMSPFAKKIKIEPGKEAMLKCKLRLDHLTEFIE